jgi:hypothetical protein
MNKDNLKKNLFYKANIKDKILQKDREDTINRLKKEDEEIDKLVSARTTALKNGDKKTARQLKRKIIKKSESDLDMVNRLEETGRKVPLHKEEQYRELEVDVYKAKMAAKDLENNSKQRLKELKSLNPLKRKKAKSLEAYAYYLGYQNDKKRNKDIKNGVSTHEVLKKVTCK